MKASDDDGGWWLGARVGTMTAFIVSMIGLGVGISGGAQLAAPMGRLGGR